MIGALISIIVTLIIVGVIWWAVQQLLPLIPLPEPFRKIIGHAIEQECRRPQSGRTLAAVPQQGAIENHGILGHDLAVTSAAMTTASRNGSVAACRN